MTNDPAERNADSADQHQPTPASAELPAASVPDNQPAESLETLLNPLLADLLYPSESDEPVTFVSCYLAQETPLTEVQIKEWQMVPPSTYVEETSVADFWEPVIAEQDWYGEDEKKRTTSFQQLKALLDQHLTGQQVFHQGETEITVYLLGRQADGTRAGIQTTIVQT